MKSRIGSAALLPTAFLWASLCFGQQLVTNVQQGTNISLALAPDGQTIVIDLLGQLWSIPVTGGGATPLTSADFVVRNPRFSPDGSQIVFQRSMNDQWDIWLLDLGSGETRQLTGAPFEEREPDFSTDGRSVVFASDRTGRFDVWELDLDFGGIRQLSRSVGDASFPTVSERGTIAYTNKSANGWSLEVLEADGSSRIVYKSEYPIRAASWRPGGSVLLFAEQRAASEIELRMIIMTPDSVVKVLTSGEDVFGFRAAWVSPAEYLYTADGGIWRRSIASLERTPVFFVAGVGVSRAGHPLTLSSHAPTGTQAARGIRATSTSTSGDARVFTAIGDLWLQTATGEIKRLTDDPFLEIDPAFGPDDEFIVFASDRSGEMDLWRMNLTSARIDQLTREPGKAFRPAFSPSGNQIAYLISRGFDRSTGSELVVVSIGAGSAPRHLTDGLFDIETPVWSADGGMIEVRATREEGVTGLVRVRPATGTTEWEPVPSTRTTNSTASDTAFPAVSISWNPRESAHDYVLQVDRLFDGTGTEYRRNMDLHIRDGRFVNVFARGSAPLPETVIDARGLTVIPGLIDMHVHQSALAGERLGRIWLGYGVTTVREVDSDSADALERQESWASGKRRGPRLLLTTSTLSEVGEYRADIFELNAEQMPDASALTAAAALGIPIFANRLLPAARLGINGLEHIGGRLPAPFGLERSLLGNSYQDVTAILATTQTSVAPTLATFGGFAALAAADTIWSEELQTMSLFHDYEREAWLEATTSNEQLENLKTTVAELVRAGTRVTAGSDAPTVPYGLGLHAELKLLSDAGLANDQVLRLATANAALTLGLESELGTIEAGKLADFLVLSGDPLNRIEDTLQIEATVLNGVWLTRDDLVSAP